MAGVVSLWISSVRGCSFLRYGKKTSDHQKNPHPKSKFTRHLDKRSNLSRAPLNCKHSEHYVQLPLLFRPDKDSNFGCALRQRPHKAVECAKEKLVSLTSVRAVRTSACTMPRPRPRNEPLDDSNHTGTFVSKPTNGRIRSDQQMLCTGVQYGVRYIGCLDVNASMKSLDFETRSLVAKECINHICEIAGLKSVDKRRKTERRISKMLAEKPNMSHAGANVDLVITSSSLVVRDMESGELIASHEMPTISFASGGDADTLDFVAYVAKDSSGRRACYVLECGGVAQDVIITIGQAFDLRYKEYLQKGMQSPSTPTESISSVQSEPAATWHDDPEYYNDLPGKIPPEAAPPVPPLPTYQSTSGEIQTNGHSNSSQTMSKPMKDPTGNLIDLSSEPCSPNPFTKSPGPEYVNFPANVRSTTSLHSPSLLDSYGPKDLVYPRDPFDMQPFEASLPPHSVGTMPQGSKSNDKAACSSSQPVHSSKSIEMAMQLKQEIWFHGPISRRESEHLLQHDGEFLVRESQGSPLQYVLSGMQGGVKKHLLLVDPEGVVRTKDKTFQSVSHLVYYHRDNGLPIISAESALVLKTAIPASRSH